MLSKRALIIGYPGEKGDDNYCIQGVTADIDNYTNHLYSVNGGAWELAEIDNNNIAITTETLNSKLRLFSGIDYSIIVFSGHGRYNNQLEETEIQLNKNTFIPVSRLNTGCNRQLIICDCCRERTDVLIEKCFSKCRVLDSESYVPNREYYKNLFDSELQKSLIGKVKIFSCSKGECAEDLGAEGGLFSHFFLKVASGNNNLSTAQTFNIAYDKVVEKSEMQQHPQLFRVRSLQNNTFPFYLA